MARTAPVPNIPPIPGMCPSVAVLAGGAGGGGGSGDGSADGNGNGPGDGSGNGDGANGDGSGANGCGTGAPGGCPTHGAPAHGDPVSLAHGEVFTVPALDLSLNGPIELSFTRVYNSSRHKHDVGLGWGWGHTFAWTFELLRDRIRVRKGLGGGAEFPLIEVAGEEEFFGGWTLRRETEGYTLRTPDGFDHVFAPAPERPDRFDLRLLRHRSGNQIQFLRDRRGALTQIVDSAGRTLVFATDTSGRTLSIAITDPSSQRTITFIRYSYDERGNLVSATNADGDTTRYTYDEQSRLTALEHADGVVYHYIYDAKGRCVETWGEQTRGPDPALDPDLPSVLADGATPARGIHHAVFEYGEGVTVAIDSVRTLRFHFDDQNRPTKGVGATGGVVNRVYDDLGNLIARVDQLGATTCYQYDDKGRLVRETDALGRDFVIQRDSAGDVVENIDYCGGTMRTTRDARGNATVIVDQKGHVTSYKFDERSLMTERVDGTGARTTYRSDSHGNLCELRQPNGATWRWSWDYFGRPIEQYDPRGGVVRYHWTDAGKMLAIEGPGRSSIRFEWDHTDGYVARHDESGTTRYLWGGHRWPIGRVRPNGDTIRYFYNREGWVTKVVNERGEHSLIEHTLAGQVQKVVGFDGVWVRYRYDAAFQLKTIEDRAGKLEIERDPVGRVLAITYPNGTTSSCEYNLRDEVARVITPYAEVAQEFDSVGNLIRETQTAGGRSEVVSSEYDAMGRRVLFTSSLGHHERYTRDPSGNLLAVELGARLPVELDNDPAGFPVATHLPGGSILRQTMDEGLRLRHRALERPSQHGAAIVQESRYEYQAEHVRSVWSNDRPSVELTYDGRGRLTERRVDQELETYGFDSAGNLLREHGTVYGPGNRLLERGSWRYVWDEVGRLDSKWRVLDDGAKVDAHAYHWDAANQLVAVDLPGGRRVEFDYDGMGRRLVKRLLERSPDGKYRAIKSVRFVWDGTRLTHAVEAAMGGAESVTTFVYSDGSYRPFAQRAQRAGEPEAPWLFFLNDPTGTPEALAYGDGRIAQRFDRDPWSGPTVQGNAPETPLRMPGQFFDEETGLFYNYYRYYDPEQGRYISRDPIGFAGGLNLYAYCPDPLAYLDPLGLRHECSASFTPGGSSETFVPTSTAGSRGTPGFESGWRDNGANRMVAGATGDAGGSRPQPRTAGGARIPVDHRERANCHTEMHAMDWAQRNFPGQLGGSQMTLGGQHPPCAMCNNAMREFSNQTPPATVEYNWPVNNNVRYHGGSGPTAVPHGPGSHTGAEATALQNAHLPGSGTSHSEVYSAQMAARRANPALADRSGHHDPNDP